MSLEDFSWQKCIDMSILEYWLSKKNLVVFIIVETHQYISYKIQQRNKWFQCICYSKVTILNKNIKIYLCRLQLINIIFVYLL